jgi:hypothetical protein
MRDAERRELAILREVVRKFGHCGIAKQREHGWETVLLKDEVKSRYKEAGLGNEKEDGNGGGLAGQPADTVDA